MQHHKYGKMYVR